MFALSFDCSVDMVIGVSSSPALHSTFLSPKRGEFGKESREASGPFLLFSLSVTGSRAVLWTALNLAANFHLRSQFCLDFG